MGGVALRFCLVLGRVLMVVYCCASGCFGCVCVVLELVPRVVRRCGSGYIGCRCIWTHLLQMQSGRCLGGVIIINNPPTPVFRWGSAPQKAGLFLAKA